MEIVDVDSDKGKFNNTNALSQDIELIKDYVVENFYYQNESFGQVCDPNVEKMIEEEQSFEEQ